VLTKKQRKAEKKLAIQMIKRTEAESQKKLKNKMKNEKRKLKQKKKSEDTTDSETKKSEDPADSSEPDEFGDLRPAAGPTNTGGTTGVPLPPLTAGPQERTAHELPQCWKTTRMKTLTNQTSLETCVTNCGPDRNREQYSQTINVHQRD
jgi:hypothetical protein